MRVRLNFDKDRIELEFAGALADLNAGVVPDKTKSITIPGGDDGPGAEVIVDLDGFVRVVRVSRLKQIFAEFAPMAGGEKPTILPLKDRKGRDRT